MHPKVLIASIAAVLLVLSVILNGYLMIERLSLKDQLQKTIESQRFNSKVLVFYKLFIEEVLNPEEDVSFETRLKLESAVRDLNDEAILQQWQRFTASQNDEQARAEVKNLLRLLVDKISQ